MTVPRWALARYLWTHQQARPAQLPPDTPGWLVWLILTGRGWGKTRTGAEETVWQAWRQPGTRWAVVAPTWREVKHVCFLGDSGIVPVTRRYGLFRPDSWKPSEGILRLPNGSLIIGYSADKPDRLRGPQHHGAWAEELAAWRYPDAWDQLKFGLRLGTRPRITVTTTPRPTPLIRSLHADDRSTVTTGSTFDNAANLAADALEDLRRRYEGTRLGRQELHAEILNEAEGALWSIDLLDRHRLARAPQERIVRRVVGVDPAVTATESSDETGIVVAALGESGTVYVEADHSGRYAPDVWGRKVAALDVDTVVAEVNQGGDMVRQVLRASGVEHRVVEARAVKGKAARAEPVSVLYERGVVRHVGVLAALEDQMATWVPGEGRSPDRVDALVWAVSHLTRSGAVGRVRSLAT